MMMGLLLTEKVTCQTRSKRQLQQLSHQPLHLTVRLYQTEKTHVDAKATHQSKQKTTAVLVAIQLYDNTLTATQTHIN